MTELHFTFGTLGQRPALLLSLNLISEAGPAEDMAAGKPFWVLSEDILANGTLELFVHQLVLLCGQAH